MKFIIALLVSGLIAGCAGTACNRSMWSWKPKMWLQTDNIPKLTFHDFKDWPEYRW